MDSMQWLFKGNMEIFFLTETCFIFMQSKAASNFEIHFQRKSLEISVPGRKGLELVHFCQY